MTNPLTQHLDISVCEDSSDAIQRGFLYRPPVFKPIQVEKVVVVRNGTQKGNSTVDFVLQDETGQKYVFMITGNLLKSIPAGGAA